MRKWLGLMILLFSGQLHSQVPALSQAPNTVPICQAASQITQIVDDNNNPVALDKVVFQFGDIGNNWWGQTFNATALPLYVNYTNMANLGWTGVTQPTASNFLPNQLIAQKNTFNYAVTCSNFDPVPTVTTVKVLALTNSNPVAACPAGTYTQIAGDITKTGYIATLQTGAVYRFKVNSLCTTALASTKEDMSQGDLLVLQTSKTQIVDVANTGGIITLHDEVVIDPVITFSNVALVIDGVSQSCTIYDNKVVCQ